MKIYLHADDCGLNERSAKRLLKCWKNGNLDSISVFMNGSFEEAAACSLNKGLRLRLHLNLVEGRCVSDPSEIPLLTDEEGYFKYSFVGLMLLLLSFKRRDAKRQIYTELRSQIEKYCSCVKSKRIRMDSHQHFHMLPSVFRILCRAAEDCGVEIEELRIPVEPLLPFLKQVSLYPTYRFSNLLKNILMKVLYCFIKKDIERKGIPAHIFMGLMFSGCMDGQRILKVLPDFVRIAEKKHRAVELLFHPGYIRPGEEGIAKAGHPFYRFYESDRRKKEEQLMYSGMFCENIHMQEIQYMGKE